MKCTKLDDLATYYNFVQQDAPPVSAFNQTGQKVGGSQVNVVIGAVASNLAIGSNVVQQINTGGGDYVRGDTNTYGGDYVVGDKIVNGW